MTTTHMKKEALSLSTNRRRRSVLEQERYYRVLTAGSTQLEIKWLIGTSWYRTRIRAYRAARPYQCPTRYTAVNHRYGGYMPVTEILEARESSERTLEILFPGIQKSGNKNKNWWICSDRSRLCTLWYKLTYFHIFYYLFLGTWSPYFLDISRKHHFRCWCHHLSWWIIRTGRLYRPSFHAHIIYFISNHNSIKNLVYSSTLIVD